jgi:hypothetical protein
MDVTVTKEWPDLTSTFPDMDGTAEPLALSGLI